MNDMRRSLAYLEQTLRGEVTNARNAIEEASFDFGRIVTRKPGLVVFPRDSEDVSKLLLHANRHRIPISTQGATHTQGGHSLNAKGIVLKTERMDGIVEINLRENWVLVNLV